MPPSLSLPLVAALLAVVFVSGAVNGTLGFGFSILAVNVIAFAMGAKEAVVVLSLISVPLSALQLFHHRERRAVGRRVLVVLGGALLGSFIGASLLSILPDFILSLALGVFTVSYVLNLLRAERAPLQAHVERTVAPFVGLTAGMTNGALGASGPVLGTYLTAIGLRGAEFAFAINLMFCSMGVVRAGTFAINSEYSAASVFLSGILLAPSFFGQRVGFALQGRLSARLLRQAVLVALLVASLNLLLRGVEGGLPVVTALVR